MFRVLNWFLFWTAWLAIGCSSRGPASGPTPTSAPPAERSPLDGMVIAAEATRLCSPELAGRGSYQEGGVKAAAYVAAEFEKLGLDVSRQDVGGGAVNVLAIKRGVTNPDKAVLVSAHYDHLGVDAAGDVFYGADDNASGTAVLLAIARVITESDSDRTIVFAAFGAEEAGLVGSGVYVKDPLIPLADTVAVVNFDMVGRNFFESGAATPDTAAVVGLDEAGVAGLTLARAAAKAHGLTLIEAPPRLLELFRLENRTDDWWFRRNGVAAIHFSTGLHDDYHQTSDTADKLVPSQLEKIAGVAVLLVAYLARDAPKTASRSRQLD